jgi:NTE family protein
MKTGLVLSGGGTRRVAHIGVLKALEEKQIEVTHLPVTSAGVIVGALYAAGHSWETILTFFKVFYFHCCYFEDLSFFLASRSCFLK